MKRPITLALLITALGVGSALAAQVSRVTLAYDNGATVATIQVQGQIRFTHQTEIPKDGKPHRVIVDVIGATYDLGAKQYTMLPPCLIKGVRGSQYSVTPEKVARIVFDLDRDPMYQVVSDAAGIHVSFPDKNQKPFALWSTPVVTPTTPATPPAKPIAETKPAPATTTVPSVKPADSKPVVKVAATESDRQTSLASKPAGPTTPVQPSAPAAKPAQVPGTAPSATSTPAAPAYKSEIKSETKPSAGTTATQQASKPPVTTSPTTSPTTPVVKPAATASSPAVTTAPQTKPASPVSGSASPATASKPTETKPATPTATPATVAPAKPATTQPSPAQPTTSAVPATPKPTTVATNNTYGPTLPAKPAEKSPVVATTPNPAVSKPAVTTPPTAVPVTTTPKPAPAISATETKPETKVATTPETKPAVAAAETKVAATPDKGGAPADAKPTELAASSPKPTPQSGILGPIAEAIKSQAKDQKASEPAADPKQLAEATPEEESENPEDAKSTARFRRSPAEQFKIKGTMVAEFPQRLVIQYKQGKNRDPFATLIDESRTFDNPIADRIPNVEGLKLVGIIESAVGDNRGLFEDKNGYSYILKSGDKVQKGYVLRVERDRVYFQVFEYGWSRTVALTIE